MNRLIESLLKPESYPGKPHKIEMMQTHISVIFLADRFVYKIKKPVLFDFLDFSTLEKRHLFLEEELKLNRRFSPGIYLDVLPVSEKDSSFFVGDNSNIVEYALWMKRLDQQKTLLNLIKDNKAGVEEIKFLGRHIASIYASFKSDDKALHYGSIETISYNVTENFNETRQFIGGPVDRETFAKIEKWSCSFLERNSALFEKRMKSGFIKECHGDLHLQHIFFENGCFEIIDCIEFNERFRYGDVASDIAFLAMDLDDNGYPKLAQIFVEAYVNASGDSGLFEVLNFYKVYRSVIRAKVASFMLIEQDVPDDEKKSAFERARDYYNLAVSYTGSIC